LGVKKKMGNLSYPKINIPAKAAPESVRKVNWLIRRLNYIKARDEKFFELNGGSLDLLQLLQWLQQARNEVKAQNNTRFSLLTRALEVT